MTRWRELLIAVLVSLTALAAVFAAEPVETREDFLLALQAAKPGDTIYVGDIEFQPLPFGIIVLNKSVSIAGAKPDGTNAVFKDATFAVSGPTGKVEISITGVDFMGRAAEETGNPDNMPDLSNPLKTQCAAFFSGNADVRFTDCTFCGYRNQYGTVYAIYSDEKSSANNISLSFGGCSFRNNLARRGGAIYLSGHARNITLNLSDCVFEQNISESGGALFADSSLVSMEGCTFKGNISNTEGGALRLQNCSTTITGGSFNDNSAKERGGALSVLISSFLGLSADNCVFSGNQSPDECCIFAEEKDTNFDAESYVQLKDCPIDPPCPALLENSLIRIVETPRAADEPEAGGKNRIIIWIIACVLLAAVAAGVVFICIMKGRNASSDASVPEAGTMDEVKALLSDRELEVMEQYLTDKSRKEVATTLCISESTVKKHIANVYSKLGVKNRQELVIKIMELTKKDQPQT